jgi:hypothetical protein
MQAIFRKSKHQLKKFIAHLPTIFATLPDILGAIHGASKNKIIHGARVKKFWLR